MTQKLSGTESRNLKDLVAFQGPFQVLKKLQKSISFRDLWEPCNMSNCAEKIRNI